MNELEMKAELERLNPENARLKNKDALGLSLKVSEKGAVSLYGLAISGHAVQGTVASPTCQSCGHRDVHPRERCQAEDKGIDPPDK